MAATVPVPVSDLTTEQTLHEILNVLLRIEAKVGGGGDDAFLTDVANQITANTEQLSTLSTDPPTAQGATL